MFDLQWVADSHILISLGNNLSPIPHARVCAYLGWGENALADVHPELRPRATQKNLKRSRDFSRIRKTELPGRVHEARRRTPRHGILIRLHDRADARGRNDNLRLVRVMFGLLLSFWLLLWMSWSCLVMEQLLPRA